MKKLLFIAILIVTNIVTGYICSHTFIWGYKLNSDGSKNWIQTPYIYNTAEALNSERELCNATTEMLHMYWEFLDKELDENGNTKEQHKFFDDFIMQTVAFETADSIREGDWEDFFCDWFDTSTEYDN